MLKTILDAVLPAVLPLLASALVAALGMLAKFLHEKAAASKAARVASVFADLAQSTVAHLDAELRPMLQQALADGKLSPEEGQALKAEAMKILKEQTPKDLVGAATAMFGASGLDVWLSGLVERAVQAAPSAPTPALDAPAVPK